MFGHISTSWSHHKMLLIQPLHVFIWWIPIACHPLTGDTSVETSNSDKGPEECCKCVQPSLRFDVEALILPVALEISLHNHLLIPYIHREIMHACKRQTGSGCCLFLDSEWPFSFHFILFSGTDSWYCIQLQTGDPKVLKEWVGNFRII